MKEIIDENSVDETQQKNNIVASFIVDEDIHRRLKVYAALNGRKIKDVVNEAFVEYLNKKESK